jgi:hypothetical protein
MTADAESGHTACSIERFKREATPLLRRQTAAHLTPEVLLVAVRLLHVRLYIGRNGKPGPCAANSSANSRTMRLRFRERFSGFGSPVTPYGGGTDQRSRNIGPRRTGS